MADTMRVQPYDADELDPGLKAVVADLNAKIEDDDAVWTAHHKDVFRAIRQCIIDRKPIDKELQEQYVQAIANNQQQDRYGK